MQQLRGINMKKEVRNFVLVTLAVYGASNLLLSAVDKSKENITNDQESNLDDLLNQKLEEYVSKRELLEQEIKDLEKKKENLKDQEKYALKDLVVMENRNISNDTSLYILKEETTSGIYEEYNHNFHAWYKMHEEGEHTDICGTYIHFDECYPLFNYLTEEEQNEASENNGIFTTSELDEISERINKEYKEKNNDKILVKSL